jgi:hypothetical protein
MRAKVVRNTPPVPAPKAEKPKRRKKKDESVDE